MLIAACIRQLEDWGATRQDAGGDLPVHGVFGVPGQWPHIRELYQRAGFVPGDTEVVYLAPVDDLPRPGPPPLTGLAARRSVGMNGTRLSAVLDGQVIGYIEVEVFEDGERQSRRGGWADVGNLYVAGDYRRRGVATWLLGQAAGWLRLAQVTRLLEYASPESGASLESGPDGWDDAGYQNFLAASHFTELTRTTRGWTRNPASPGR